MLTEPLPTTLDVRKAAAREVVIQGVLNPLDLQRFRGMLAADEGAINATLAFFRDEQQRCLVRVEVQAQVKVICQRCLEVMDEEVGSENTLAIVWSDDQAAQLPRHLDPLIVTEQTYNLRDLVEEELILAMKPFSYHNTEECHAPLEETGVAYTGELTTSGVKSNPFDILAQLKTGQEP
ncbi:MAG: YceD family protein [Pseudomonadota bacterium]